MDKNIRTSTGPDGILVARIDMPGRVMNVFSLAMMDSLEALIEQVAATAAVKGVVLTSAKPTFLVGADLDMIGSFAEQARSASAAALHRLCGRLGGLFRRLERSHKPYVAAINGLALGGGLELAMACHERVAAHHASVQLGLPEIKLGLLPGAGGTQRLPRMIGAGMGVSMLLTGESLSASRALHFGLVDALAAPDALVETARARALALALARPCAPWDRPDGRFDAGAFDFGHADLAEQVASHVGISAYQRAHYPAYDAIISCVRSGWNRPMDEACRLEMDIFVDLIRDPVAGNMVRTLFLNRQRLAREGQAPAALAEARVAVAGDSAPMLRNILEQARAPLADPTRLTEIDIVLTGAGAAPGTGTGTGTRIAWLRESASLTVPHDAAAGFWLADPTDHGRAAEIVVSDPLGAGADAGRKLAQWFRATLLVSTGASGLLPALARTHACATNLGCDEDAIVLAVALAAARSWRQGDVADRDAADVVAVLAGLTPAYSGGPFAYLAAHDKSALTRLAAVAAKARTTLMFDIPDQIEPLLNASASAACA